jgi:hypothetical protein
MKIRRSIAIVFFLICSCFSMLNLAPAEEYRLGEFFAGYSLLHGDLQQRASGWEVSGGKNFNQRFSIHADFDAHHQSSAAGQRHQHDFLFGPQFSHRTHHFTLFAHALAGGCRTSGSLGTETGFASVAGGGMDWDNQSSFSFRLAQVDYQRARLFGGFQNQARLSFGIVFRLVEFRDHAPLPPPEKQDIRKDNSVHRASVLAVSPS